MERNPFELAAPRERVAALNEVERVESRGRRFETHAHGCKVAWHCWGAGPAVVLVHGGSGAWNHWIRNVEVLADTGFTVLAPDLPGFGDSDEAPQPHAAATLAMVLRDGLRNAEGLPSALLEPQATMMIVGFSFGGVVAAHLARLEQPRTRKLVMVGAMGLGVGADGAVELRSWKRAADQQAFLEIQRHNLGALMFHDPARIDPVALGLHLRNTAATRFVSKWISRSDEALGLLTELDLPLHGIWGEHDATAGQGVAERERLFRAISPASGFDVVDNAGHWVQYEQPAAFNAALLAALKDR